MDHLAINEAFFDLNAAWLRDARAFTDYCRAFHTALQSTGRSVLEEMRNDRRWKQNYGNGGEAMINWVYNLAWSSRQFHQVLSQWLSEYVKQAPDLDPDLRRRALFWVRQIVEMLAPSNFFWTNPKAVRCLIESQGESLLQGIASWLKDLQHGDHLPELTDRTAFVVGETLATTPGMVVYRNSLMELIQYAPQSAETWRVPIVLIQPWINKYYVFDLTPQNSFVRFLVGQGFPVFITSWKNPTHALAHLNFEDYMLKGALQAIKVALEICGTRQVHAAGYCIGGTLLAALLGWLAHDPGEPPVADATLFATLLDFEDPGDLKAFVNPRSLKEVERLVASEGILDSRHLALAFRLLNSGDLIWRSLAATYFYGEMPPRSDMLFWNSDSTSLPGAMCVFYLKAFYLENRMVQPGKLILDQRAIDLKQVKVPIYAVGALKDHICPWPATFQTCRLTSSPVRYVLANEGHITGIVNPPAPWSKKRYWAGAASRRRNAFRWLEDKAPVNGSWWPDWIEWLQPRSGGKWICPPMGSPRHRPLAAAPGSYVLE